jgi:hypothetical protein
MTLLLQNIFADTAFTSLETGKVQLMPYTERLTVNIPLLNS